MREFLAELLGTFILVLFGDGAVAQVVLGKSARKEDTTPFFGGFLNICLGYGLALMIGICIRLAVISSCHQCDCSETHLIHSRYSFRTHLTYLTIRQRRGVGRPPQPCPHSRSRRSRSPPLAEGLLKLIPVNPGYRVAETLGRFVTTIF